MVRSLQRSAAMVLHRAWRRRCGRGFTLTELMVVVAIMGVLAVIAVAAVRRHVQSSKSVEALSMVQSIRAAQERWRSEHMTYLDVSAGANWYPRDPVGTDNVKTTFHTATGGHVDEASWKLLDPTVSGPVDFGYLVTAGLPNETMTAVEGPVTAPWPEPPGEYWYVIQAKGDVDRNGKPSYYIASSIKADVLRVNEGE